jgi:hypothetical protein
MRGRRPLKGVSAAGWPSDWPPGCYDFYLCGRGDMIRDVMAIIDDPF